MYTGEWLCALLFEISLNKKLLQTIIDELLNHTIICNRGKVLLIVNVASNCSFTKRNYQELNELYAKYRDQGFMILGFPCNQFGEEPKCETDIKEFMKKHHVEWDAFAKINVNGENSHPLYKYLKNAIGGTMGNFIKWNFTKYLIDKQGKPVARYAPSKNPMKFEEDIKNELAKSA